MTPTKSPKEIQAAITLITDTLLGAPPVGDPEEEMAVKCALGIVSGLEWVLNDPDNSFDELLQQLRTV